MENSNTFDPKPFIRTFESSLEELEKLASKMQKHTSELERETQKEELAFKKQVKELGTGFDVSITSSWSALCWTSRSVCGWIIAKCIRG